jgi:transposase
MPWKISDLLEQREEFVKRAERREECFSRICRTFGISRQTGYKWLSRFSRAGRKREALKDLCRRPHNNPRKVGPDVTDQVLNLRSQLGWGARKLCEGLKQRGIAIAPSTIHRILKTNDRLGGDDPNAASWTRQLLVDDDPCPRIAMDVPKACMPADFADRLQHGRATRQKKGRSGARETQRNSAQRRSPVPHAHAPNRNSLHQGLRVRGVQCIV